MPRRPVCTGARAWTAWAPTAACAGRGMGAPAASWTWTSARASRASTGASATTWSTGERAPCARRREGCVRSGLGTRRRQGAAGECMPAPGSGATARTLATRASAASRRCWSARRCPARTTRPASRASGASAASAGQVRVCVCASARGRGRKCRMVGGRSLGRWDPWVPVRTRRRWTVTRSEK